MQGVHADRIDPGAAGLRRVSGVDAGRRAPLADGLGARRAAAGRGRLHGGDLSRRAHHRAAHDAGSHAAPPDRERVRRAAAAGLPARQGRRRLPVRQQRRRMGRRRSGDPAADGEPSVAWRVPDGPRDVVRHDGERLPLAHRSARRPRRLPARAPSPAACHGGRLREGVRARCVAVATRGSGAAQRSVGVGPHVVSGVAVPGRHRSGVARQPVAAGARARRARRRPGAAVPRVPRGAEPARSRRHPEESARLRAAGSRRSRVCRLLRPGGRRPQQQDAAAVGSRHDRARVRVQDERGHSHRGGAHPLREGEPAGEA